MTQLTGKKIPRDWLSCSWHFCHFLGIALSPFGEELRVTLGYVRGTRISTIDYRYADGKARTNAVSRRRTRSR